jgi:hypothetical protein
VSSLQPELAKLSDIFSSCSTRFWGDVHPQRPILVAQHYEERAIAFIDVKWEPEFVCRKRSEE